MTTPTLICPHCHLPLTTFVQPALMAHQTAKVYADCRNREDCPNYYNTQRDHYYLPKEVQS